MNLMMIPPRYQRACDAVAQPDRSGHVKCISQHGFHDMAYVDWGSKTADQQVLCVHGLTRNSRDFDILAARLSKSARVVCPDLVGRGKSDWLPNAQDYHLLQYNIDATVLMAQMGMKKVDWIGTSLGGLMGISMASLEGSPVRRLVINDIAPTIPTPALMRIFKYLGSGSKFETLEEIEVNLRHTLSPFGPMTDDDWARMAVHSAHAAAEGLEPHHDPGIMQNFRRYALFVHFNLWRNWEKITCPVLVLRGTESDFLTSSLLSRMTKGRDNIEVVEFDGVGHTPTLNAPEQIDPIVDWLDRTKHLIED